MIVCDICETKRGSKINKFMVPGRTSRYCVTIGVHLGNAEGPMLDVCAECAHKVIVETGFPLSETASVKLEKPSLY